MTKNTLPKDLVDQCARCHMRREQFSSNFNFERANYYLKQGNLQKGIEGYEKSLKIDNINNQVRLDLANLYYRNQEF